MTDSGQVQKCRDMSRTSLLT